MILIYKKIIILVLLNSLYCQLFLTKDSKNKNIPILQNTVGMQLVEIPTGDFIMGCKDGDASCDEDELPNKKTYITNSFYMGKYEVTRGQFARFILETSYKTDAEKGGFKNTWKNCYGIKQTDLHPVICVSWNDAKEFLKWLSEKENKTYRLPTEAEWEYVARAKSIDFSISKNSSLNLSIRRFYWGYEMDESFAWYNKNSNKTTHPVGEKKPNVWGLYDLAGNVWEWCEDSYDRNYYKEEKDKSVLNTNYKSFRGGSWFDSYLLLRVSARNYAPKDARESHIGFRVVLEN